MDKVFIVRITQVYEGDELRNDVKCCSTREKALNEAKAFIEDEKEWIANDSKAQSWCINDNLEKNGEWEAYESGYYCQNHTSVSIFEEDVI